MDLGTSTLTRTSYPRDNNEVVIFKSTSEAASVILGVQTSGPKTWKDANGNLYADNIKNEFKAK